MTDPSDTPPQFDRSDVYLVLIAQLDQLTAQKLVNAVCLAQQGGAERIHILLQTMGGGVHEGIMLHNFLRSCAVEIVTYNIGAVLSAGVVAYMGGHRRVVAKSAAFMLHRSHASFQGANSIAVAGRAATLALDDRRTDELILPHLNLTKEQLEAYDRADLLLDAGGSVAAGIATEIGTFSARLGCPFVNVHPY